MATFVRIRASSAQCHGRAPQLFVGRMQARSRELTSDYDLYDLERGRSVAHLEAYPRGTESAIALFLRLLLRAEAHVLGQVFQDALETEILVGPDLSRSLTCEVLHIKRLESSVVVTLLSPEALVADRQVRVESGANVRSVVCTTLVSAMGWLSAPAALPAPLSEVLLRNGAEHGRFIALADLPALTAQRVRTYFGLSPCEDVLDAQLWMKFLRRLIN